MLPVATPPNAIAYATGRIELKNMLRRGVVLNLVGVALVRLFVPTLGALVFDI
jgi:sodium-dependent dicarboxylate transporter 2/3/5